MIVKTIGDELVINKSWNIQSKTFEKSVNYVPTSYPILPSIFLADKKEQISYNSTSRKLVKMEENSLSYINLFFLFRFQIHLIIIVSSFNQEVTRRLSVFPFFLVIQLLLSCCLKYLVQFRGIWSSLVAFLGIYNQKKVFNMIRNYWSKYTIRKRRIWINISLHF